MLTNIVILLVAQGSHVAKDSGVYLSSWAVWSTFLTFAIGVYLSFFVNQSELKEQNKRSFCSAWKWWVYLYQQSLVWSILATLAFWSLIWPAMLASKGKTGERLKNDVYWKIEMILDHSTPLFCLLLDYSVNAIPMARRHVVPILATSTVYLLVNLIYVKASGRWVYKFLSWESFLTVLIALAIGLVMGLMHYCLFRINIYKLTKFAEKRDIDSEAVEILLCGRVQSEVEYGDGTDDYYHTP